MEEDTASTDMDRESVEVLREARALDKAMEDRISVHANVGPHLVTYHHISHPDPSLNKLSSPVHQAKTYGPSQDPRSDI